MNTSGGAADPAKTLSVGPIAPPQLPGITLNATPLSYGPDTAIYRGWDRSRRCDVAVKVQRVTDNPTALARLRREAELMNRLRHPGTIALFHFYDGDPAALVMEYVPGQTLLDLVKTSGPLKPERAVQIIEEVASVLDSIHAQGIIHRDITPSHILLAQSPLPFRSGMVKLTDFGVARIEAPTPLTIMGDVLGTVEYVSPEQVHGSVPPDARSDLYSLAAVAYFALTGTPPFRPTDSSPQSQLSVMHRQVFAEPPPLRLQRPELTPQIEKVVLRGLAKAPEARYASAGQFAAALRAVIAAPSGEDRVMAAASRRTGILTGALVGLAVLLLGAVLLWKTGRSPSSIPLASSRVASSSLASPSASPGLPALPSAVIPPTSMPLLKPLPFLSPRQKAAPLPRSAARPKSVAQHGARGRTGTPHRVTPVPLEKPITPEKFITPEKRHHPAILLAQALPPRLPRPKIILRKKHRTELTAHRPLPAQHRPGFLLLYANQNVAALGHAETMANIPARALIIDGKSVAVPPPGGWIALPPGKHWVSYYPDTHSKFGATVAIPITVATGAHVRRQVLLPLAIDKPTTLVDAYPATVAAPAPASTAVEADNSPSPSVPQISVPHTPAPHTPAPPVSASSLRQAFGWYSVSGWIPAPQADSLLPLPQVVRVSAQQVLVDGLPNLTLALGQWAQLPAGKHTITFQPTHGVPAAPKTWDITLDPLARLNQQIPLPALPPVTPSM